MFYSYIKDNKNVIFLAIQHDPITEYDAMKAQDQAGFHPNGYGFYGFKCIRSNIKPQEFKATWSCSTNCD